jgi:enoyl-[acyl-carrier protein] reductase III
MGPALHAAPARRRTAATAAGSEEGRGGAGMEAFTLPRVAFSADSEPGGFMGAGLSVDLAGRRALVTGGSRGIGAAIAKRLSEAGCDVAINYLRNKKPAEEMAAAVRAKGRRALLLKGNVADPETHDGMFEAIEKEWGGLDVLVSNAASGVIKPAMELTPKHWTWTMDINAAALLPLVQHAAKLMGEAGGHVVAVSSLGAVRAIPQYAAVGASKAALESLVRHLAVELAPRGIHVNAVSAGVVDTDALKYFPHREQMLTEGARRTPAGRLVEPKDVADAVLFLVSPLSRMVVGQTLVVDGGYSVVG